jgi:hypothetical protein
MFFVQRKPSIRFIQLALAIYGLLESIIRVYLNYSVLLPIT